MRSSKVVSGERTLLKRVVQASNLVCRNQHRRRHSFLQTQLLVTAGNVLPGLGARARSRHDGGLGVRDGCGHRSSCRRPSWRASRRGSAASTTSTTARASTASRPIPRIGGLAIVIGIASADGRLHQARGSLPRHPAGSADGGRAGADRRHQGDQRDREDGRNRGRGADSGRGLRDDVGERRAATRRQLSTSAGPPTR